MRTVKQQHIGVAFVRLVALRGVLRTAAPFASFFLIRVPGRCLVVLSGLLALASVTAEASDPQGEVRRRFDTPNAGDCVIEVVLAPGDDPAAVRILLNDHELSLKVGKLGPLVFQLRDPLHAKDLLTGLYDGKEFHRVMVSGSQPKGASVSCPGQEPSAAWDQRSAFEALGFLGRAIDSFSPAQNRSYADGTTGSKRTRYTGGAKFQLRLLGPPDADHQLWLGGEAVYGVRSSDIDCDANPNTAICLGKPAAVFEVIEHASSLEAHFDSRYEFATLNRNSETPVRVFAALHAGFVAVDEAPQVYQVYDVGAGITLPSGQFRGSSVYWGFGGSQLLEPDVKRLKVRALLTVDLVPGLRDRAAFWKWAGFGSWRGFFAINVDQSIGAGSDSVQSYFGVAFDFGRAFRPM